MTFIVSSPQFSGPVDLLLYLVRRHEIEITSIGMSRLVQEYLDYLEVLNEISIDGVGDFIETASLLLEIKTRQVLPRNEFEQDNLNEEFQDPREDLVRRLLMYKQFRDASLVLEERGSNWRRRFARTAHEFPTPKVEVSDQPLEGIELWDLVSAFGRVLRESRPKPTENITIDETPIHVYMQRIHARLVEQGKISFTDLFESQIYKSSMIGIFLAVLELTRHHNVQAEQSDIYSEIVLIPGPEFSMELDVSQYDDYNPNNKTLGTGDPGSLVD